MSETMRRVSVVAPGEVRVDDVPRPSPQAGEVLVRTAVAGVCGSDTHAAAGQHPFVPLPYNPGHEVVGVIAGVGEGVSGYAAGDRVTVEPTLPCWACKMCSTGRSNLCENLRFFGCGHAQGGMADYFTIPAGRLHRVPEHFTDAEAALIEPLATPVHAVRLAGADRPAGPGGLAGRAVAIIGAGTIGLLVLKAARHAGARRIVMTDPLPAKRELALRLGADAVVDARGAGVPGRVRAELGESADVVFDCVAIQATVDQAIAMALKAGTVVIVGVARGPVTVPLPEIQDQQVRIQGSATYLPEDYTDSIEIIASGAVRAEDFVTATFPMERAAEAFAAAVDGSQVKVLVRA
ncbi:zinc-binding dehydrogenase [Pseudactinotalea sp. HY160]|uniref:zinc-dependent alcohol dehydrogenase n=1 Tax=Pseudactinotalea sp. HY160 TaxID=2654490 RepID=UPI00351B6035